MKVISGKHNGYEKYKKFVNVLYESGKISRIKRDKLLKEAPKFLNEGIFKSGKEKLASLGKKTLKNAADSETAKEIAKDIFGSLMGDIMKGAMKNIDKNELSEIFKGMDKTELAKVAKEVAKDMTPELIASVKETAESIKAEENTEENNEEDETKDLLEENEEEPITEHRFKNINHYKRLYRETLTSDKKPDIIINDNDTDIFTLLGRCSQALKKVGKINEAKEMANRVFDSTNYDEALNIMQEYVNFIGHNLKEARINKNIHRKNRLSERKLKFRFGSDVNPKKIDDPSERKQIIANWKKKSEHPYRDKDKNEDIDLFSNHKKDLEEKRTSLGFGRNMHHKNNYHPKMRKNPYYVNEDETFDKEIYNNSIRKFPKHIINPIKEYEFEPQEDRLSTYLKHRIKKGKQLAEQVRKHNIALKKKF